MIDEFYGCALRFLYAKGDEIFDLRILRDKIIDLPLNNFSIQFHSIFNFTWMAKDILILMDD